MLAYSLKSIFFINHRKFSKNSVILKNTTFINFFQTSYIKWQSYKYLFKISTLRPMMLRPSEIRNRWKYLRCRCNDYSQSMKIKIKNIKWKNEKALKGSAYIPTEIEHLANIVTHGIWIFPALLGTSELTSRSRTTKQVIAAWIYGTALILLFFISTIFHSAFYCNHNRALKNVLHRCDRAMIYIFIAGSYFPWLYLDKSSYHFILSWLQWIIWILTALGITYQQMFHERFKCLETLLYIIIGIGPSTIVILSGHEFNGMTELKFGGCLYILGVCFFKSDGLIPCAHAIWHLFVGLAAAVHYFAILKYLFPNIETVN